MAARTKDLEELSDEELEAENQRLMAERAEAEIPIKEAQMAVQAEVSRRADKARFERAFGELDDEGRARLAQMLKSEG